MGDLKKAFAPTHELILFHAEDQFKFQRKRPCDVIHCRKVQPGKLVHPNEKPVGLMETIILDCVPYGGTVLDMFMGSGTTGVAAVNTGRNFIGMELNPEYWQIAEARIAEALQKAKGMPQKSAKTKGGQMDVFDLMEENE